MASLPRAPRNQEIQLKKTQTISGLVAAMILIGGSVYADATADARKAIEAQYAKIGAALAKKDIDGVAKFCAPDWKNKAANGKTMTLEEWKTALKVGIQQFGTVKFSVKVKTVKLKGNMATVTNDQTFEATVADSTDNKTHTFKQVENCNDVLVKTPKGWLMKASETVSVKEYRDGKPTKPGA
jgi:ketosteroid isomerase-like protein